MFRAVACAMLNISSCVACKCKLLSFFVRHFFDGVGKDLGASCYGTDVLVRFLREYEEVRDERSLLLETPIDGADERLVIACVCVYYMSFEHF